MSFCLRLMLAWVMVLTLGFSTAAFAQHKKQRAIAELSQVDADFSYQGEFIGSIPTASGWQTVGLQVMANGSGTFAAVLYPGGLPGNGWTRSGKVTLSGERNDEVVELVGEGYQIDVESNTALIHAADSQPLAQIVKVYRISPTLGALPPENAIVLFDGTNTRHFKDGKITRQGWLQEGTETVGRFQDFTLHIEFRLPYMPQARKQGRSNSGVYLTSRYEVQILDSFGLEGIENECGALYKLRRPDVNMCLPPLSWQTYDIDFRSPQFDDKGQKVQHARITVSHNGVVIHDNLELTRKTGAGSQESPQSLPTKLQNHRNPIRFRNIWIVDYDKTAKTVKQAAR